MLTNLECPLRNVSSTPDDQEGAGHDDHPKCYLAHHELGERRAGRGLVGQDGGETDFSCQMSRLLEMSPAPDNL